jgi:hypothetical protein
LFYVAIGYSVVLNRYIINCPGKTGALQQEVQTLWNINDIAGWIERDGRSGNNPFTNNPGVWYPRGTANVIYQDGIIWGGVVTQSHFSGNPDVYRVGGQTYRVGTQAGHIAQAGTSTTPPIGSDPNQAFIYRIRADWQTLTISDPEVIQDAAELNNVDTSQVTPAMAQAVLDGYQWAWENWPGDIGAPFYDLNSNSQWDPGTDEPGLADADQVIWFVCNDLNSPATLDLYGSQPIGLELQVTMWGYHQAGAALGQASFRRYRLINKSGFPVDSMFVAQWSDPDIGNSSDDFAGCDSVKILGYAYNGNPTDTEFQAFGLPPAAAGYTLLQGPIVPSPGDTAIFNFHRILDYKNLPMTSYGYYIAGNPLINDPNLGEHSGTLQWYNLLNGFIPTEDVLNPTPYTHGSGPHAGQATKFPLNGDPVAGSGDIDGQGNNFPPGDRRMAVCSGPFTMQNGDTQEVVLAISGGIVVQPGSNNITSVAQLKMNTDFIRSFWNNIFTGIAPAEIQTTLNGFKLEQNYPNPFNPETHIQFVLVQKVKVKLEVFNVLGQRVKTLEDSDMTPGKHVVPWDGGSDFGMRVGSGIYFYRLKAGDYVKTRKMILLK